MFQLLRRNRFLVTVTVLMIVSAGLVVSRGEERLRNDTLGRIFLDVMAPVMRVATEVTHTIGGVWTGITAAFQLRDQVRFLRTELRERKREVARLTEVQLENERLRRLLAFRPEVREEVVTARVIGADALGISRSLAIDRGDRKSTRLNSSH